jgi:hypothetical protein
MCPPVSIARSGLEFIRPAHLVSIVVQIAERLPVGVN